MKLSIKRLSADAILPRYAHPGDAACDLFSAHTVELLPGERAQVGIGVAFEIPEGYAGLIWDKSGLSHKFGLKTLGGVVDSGFRGEVMVGLVNLGKERYTIHQGDKVAQMLFQRVETVELVEVGELSETVRGGQGFGSTGK